VTKTSSDPPAYRIDGTRHAAPKLAPGLYVVATPIGHLGDVTLRALATLAAADLIACEDTRVTSRLTGRYGIDRPLTAYHEHNAERQRPKLLARLDAGEAVALVSDAGTPLISDPGYRLVTEAIAAGHSVVPVPGANAALAALAGAGLPTDTFLFAGFLPPKQVARGKRLDGLAAIPATLIFYEAPQRLAAALADMAAHLGADRSAAVAREMTKTFETFRRGRLGDLAQAIAGEPTPKGELVVLVGPPQAEAADPEAADAILRALIATLPVGKAAAEAARQTGLPRNTLYDRARALKDEPGGR
jgi:16S rRNA (cytidine1402-2'-O)-methyltransferase